MPERRQHERFELLAQVELTHGGQVETLATINISAGGLLLRNDHDVTLAIGDQIRIAFDEPELGADFTIEATIVRVIARTAKAGLLAAMWTSSDPAATDALGRLLWNLRSG